MSADVAKVGVFEDGRIVLNGGEASIADVRKAFLDLASRQGVVWYYREAAQKEPHANAMLVIEAIVDAKLPVSMSTKEDFSDVVLTDGTTKPR